MTDNTARAQVGWRFWFWWVLASTVGLAVGSAMLFVIAGRLNSLSFYGSLFALWFGIPLLLALFVVPQWLVLRRQISRAGWWVLASTVGYTVGFVVVGVVFRADWIVAHSAAVGAVVGASVGIAQWLVLRRQISRTGWWVLASTVGLAVGLARYEDRVLFVAVTLEEADFTAGDPMGFVVAAVVAFAVGLVWYAAFTGAVLVWLLWQPVSEEPSLPQEAA